MRSLFFGLACLAMIGGSTGCSTGSMDDTNDGGPGGDDGGGGDSTAPPKDGGTDTKGSDGATTDSGKPPTDSGAPKDTAPVDAGAPLTPGDPGPSDVKLTIRSDTAVHAISPLVYGTNGTASMATNKQTIVRSGGNRLTAYNWENNASNAGSDWCFQNDGLMSSSDTAGDGIKPMVEEAKSNGAASLVTIPIVDYVAADKLGGSGPPDCSGDIRKSGSGYLGTRCKQNKAAKGSAFSLTPDASDGFVYQDEFVNWLKTSEAGAQVIFSMDNEPDLWADTHAEVHPAKVGYDELCTRNVDFATAVKNAWPGAEVTGFVSYGWYGYETLQDAPDKGSKGEFVAYYLDQMKAAEAKAGKRLIDYLDLHWYSEATGGGVRITGPDTGSAVVDAREQAPRSLWDATYTETSWITGAIGGPIDLIHRMQKTIADHYPGTKLAFSEWNYGGGTSISGAIAGADVLGALGAYGVDLATMWPLNGDESFTYGAFQAYRNYDGAGAAFGDTSISATSSDVPTATVWASMNAGDVNHVVIVAVNKASGSKTAGITVAHPTSFTKAKVFQITSASATPKAAADLSAVATNAFSYAMPGQSVSVIVPQP
jgi:hypothetical protein